MAYQSKIMKALNLEHLGKGMFTQAYRNIATGQALIHSSCPMKEGYAMWLQGNPLVPKVTCDNVSEFYHMPLYPKIRSPKKQLNAKAYELYQYLRKAPTTVMRGGCMDTHYTYFLQAPSHSQDLIEMKEELCNYGSIYFEISPRNITCDVEGNLILLDCFFSSNEYSKTRGNQRHTRVFTLKDYARHRNITV